MLLKALEREGMDGGEWSKIVDLLPLFFRLTLDTATEFLFGESTNTQQLHLQPWTSEGQQALAFANAFDRSQYILGKTVPLGEFYWLGHTPELKRLVKEVHVWAARYVQIALDYRADPKAFDEKYGEKYIFLHALAKQTQNPDELRQEVLNILLAGRDTTASLLSWFFYLMASKENAGYYQNLRTAILNDFGHDEKSITFEGLKSCQYLQWCINETLRLYPVVPINVRTAVVDTSLPVGGGPDGASPVYVKKGQDVYYSVSIFPFLLFVAKWKPVQLILCAPPRSTPCIAARISGVRTPTPSSRTGGAGGSIRGAIFRSTGGLESASASSLRSRRRRMSSCD